jgi:methionyl-tRNA synthetase
MFVCWGYLGDIMDGKKSACEDNFVSFADFEKLDIRIGTIKAVKQHPHADKLYILLLEMGEGENDRQLVAGIKPWYKEDELIGKQIAVIANLEHKEIRGVHSQGMLLAADDGDNPVSLLVTDRKVNDNAKVK